jgi:transposase-like protein
MSPAERKDRIEQALELARRTGMSLAAAAQHFGLSPTTAYSARERLRVRELKERLTVACPCCKSRVDSADIDASVLTAAARKSLQA